MQIAFLRRYIRTNVLMNDTLGLPSIEEVQQMERQIVEAIESLEMSNGSIKCHRYDMANRIAVLRKRIKCLNHRHGNKNSNKNDDVKTLKEELADLNI